jgi:hypothetical protein
MRVLFIHQNILGQFRHDIGALCADAGNSAWAIGGSDAAARAGALFPRLDLVAYTTPAAPAGGHPWLVDGDAQLRRGQVVARAMQQVKDKGIGFDVIVAHPGWGEAMFVKDVFPATPLLTDFEFFHAATRADVGFDPEFPTGPERAQRLRVRNLLHLCALNACDAGMTPTRWQHSWTPRESLARIRLARPHARTRAARGRARDGRAALPPETALPAGGAQADRGAGDAALRLRAGCRMLAAGEPVVRAFGARTA